MNANYKCTVRLLDDDTEVLQCDFQGCHKGDFVMDYVCQQLNLVEKDYFGLRYVDGHKQRHWLDLTRSIIKQVKDMNPIVFCFRVKFYPPDPFRLKEEITRYQIYLQLRRDLLHGRLYCSQSDAVLLSALIIQAELGDYDPNEHSGNYISEFKLLLKQSPKLEEKMMEMHQSQLKGQNAAAAEMNFLRKACLMDTYGVDPHPVKDHRGNQLYLGINHAGILTFQGSRKTHHFRWNDVQKLNYEGKMFIVHLVFNEKKHTVGFKCPTGSACKHLWRCAVEQRLFFTLNSSADAPSIVTGGSIFSWGSKFKYSGRVEKELLDDSGVRREEPLVSRGTRANTLPRKSQSVPATPSTPVSDGNRSYDSLPRSNHSVPLPDSHWDESLVYGLDLSMNSPYGVADGNMPVLEPLMEDAERVLPPRCCSVDEEDSGETRKRPSSKVFERAESLPSEVEAKANEDGSSGYNAGPSGTPYDYYYHQDYYKHSSSESQLDTGDSYLQGQYDPYSLSRATQTPIKSTSGPAAGAPSKRFNVLRVFVPSLVFVIIAMAIVFVVVMESESDFLSPVRRMPEMIVLRREYYEPLKEYLQGRFEGFL